MVLYGNNYNSKFNISTAVLAALAAAIVTLVRNTVNWEHASSLDAAGVSLLVLAGVLLVVLAVGILYTIVSAHVWPVEVKDLLRVLAGHPGSLFELANKCNRCGVSSLLFALVVYFGMMCKYISLTVSSLSQLPLHKQSEISGVSSRNCFGEKDL